MSMKNDIMDYIRGTIEEDATPEEYQALLDDTLTPEVRGHIAYVNFRKSADFLKGLGGIKCL